jgi:hypothetical protein
MTDTLLSADHYEMMAFFERLYKGHLRLDREQKELWAKGCVYQHGETNFAFKAFRHGIAYGRATQ